MSRDYRGTPYTVSIPVSVETWARNPGEAFANANRAIRTDNTWGRRVRLAREHALVRLTRDGLSAQTFYTRAATMRAIAQRRAWVNLQERAVRTELRQRNLEYGRASDTIGRLRAQVATLRAERSDLVDELNRVSGGWEARLESRHRLRDERDRAWVEAAQARADTPTAATVSTIDDVERLVDLFGDPHAPMSIGDRLTAWSILTRIRTRIGARR